MVKTVRKSKKPLTELEQKIRDLKKSLPAMQDWRSTDEQEIARRQLRALEQPPAIRNLTPKHRIFSTFEVTSPESELTYYVEIRELAGRDFHSTSPDFSHNGLGTCKHTEAVLFHLQKRFPGLYKKALKGGSGRCDLVEDTATKTLRLVIPANADLPRGFRLNFDKKGLLKPAKDPLKVLAKAGEIEDANFRVCQSVVPFLESRAREREALQLRRDYEQRVQSGEYPPHETKLPLFPYQREGMLHLAFGERAMVADEMGLGKTPQGIAAAALLHRMGKATRCLVVTPASLKTEWEEQIEKFTELPCEVVYGSRQQRVAIYQNPSAFFTIVNYEQVRSDALDINAAFAADIVILDEAQRIKNWASKTARAIKRLESRYAFVLTGTPIENRIDEIYSITEFLNPAVFGPLFRFNRDHYTFDETGKPEGYRNLDKMREKLQPVMLRRRKYDVETELPERTDEIRFVELTEGQRREHDENAQQVSQLLARAKKRALRKEEHEFLMVLLGKMRMLCDTQFILDRETRVSPKLDELVEIFDTALADPDTKIIVFSEWIGMLTLIRDHLESQKIGFAWHTGSVPQTKRRKEITAFKQDPDCRIFLCTESGGSGLNLQNASVVINVDLPWNPAKLEQRIARAWRKGQSRPVTVINLIARQTIEHGMLETLALKQGLSDGVLDGLGKLSEVKLKRGGQSFLTRLQQTLMTGENTVIKKFPGRKKVSKDPGADFAVALKATLKDKLISCEEQFITDTEAPPKIVLVLQKDTPKTREGIMAQLKEAMPYLSEASTGEIEQRLLILDESQAAALEKFQRLGLVQTKVRARRNLLGKTESAPKNELSEEDQKRLEELEADLAKKLKTVSLLLPADLWEEAIPALAAALLGKAQMRAIKEGSHAPKKAEELHDPAYAHLLAEAELTVKFLTDPDSEIVENLAKSLS
ncbi:MAG: SNF2 family DNA or RNA helicase [Akkermansiaceae bacterium]|jgi:SNF2 family DNA or RNA helicase